MGLAQIAMFADDAGKVTVLRSNHQPYFFFGFTARAGIGRFPKVRIQLSAAGAPAAEIRLLVAFHEQHLLVLVKTVEQRGDFVGQTHCLQ